jgi:hypothetical protein
VLSWGVASMEETISFRNNLPMLFLHLSVTSIGNVGRQMARPARLSLDLMRFVPSGR